MYREVLFALGGNVALLAAVSWLIKSILTHILSKDIETYKQTLKAASDKAIIEHDTVFRSLHAKRADIIANLHSQFVEVGNCLNSVNNNLQNQKSRGLSPEILAEESGQLMKCLSPCLDYFFKNKLYYSLDLSNKIESLLLECIAVATLTAVTQEHDLSSAPFVLQETFDSLDKATIPERISKIVSDFNVTIKEIENTFRTIVGITE